MQEGVRLGASGVAGGSQRITAAELSSLIDVLSDDDIEAGDSPPAERVGQQEWDWDRYAAELGLPGERLAVGRELVDLLSEAIAEKNLPWQPVFCKGYAAFKRSRGYNTIIVDVSGRRSGLTPGQVYQAMRAKRVYGLMVIEEEARLDNELAAYPATPENVAQRFAMSVGFAGNVSPRVSSAMPGESRRRAASTTKRTDRAHPHAPTPAVVALPRNGAIADPRQHPAANCLGSTGLIREGRLGRR